MESPNIYNKGTRALIFDYGGTLDTGGRHWGRVLWQVWQQAKVPVSESAFRDAYVQAERMLAVQPLIHPDTTFRQTLDTKLHLELRQVGCDDYRPQVLEIVYQQTMQHTAHSRAVLQQLARRCPLVLVSNFYGNLHTVLHEFGFDGLFAHVVESAVVGVRKPDARIFQLGAEALGLQPAEVTVVGDSLAKDIIPARQAGCRTVWLCGQQWTDEPVDASVADHVITDLKELL